MDDRNNSRLRLIKGKCAGKEGRCPNEDLIIDGYCVDCAAEHIEQMVLTVQLRFDTLVQDYPEHATRDANERFNTEPFITFVKRVAGLRNEVLGGNFMNVDANAIRLLNDLNKWDAFTLTRRAERLGNTVGQSSTEGTQLMNRAIALNTEGKYADAIIAARQSLEFLEPLEKIRRTVAQRLAERSRRVTENKAGGDMETQAS